MPAPIALDSTTCLLLIDIQTSFLHPTHWGSARSNPSHEANISALLSAFRRSRSSASPPPVIHVQHLSPNPSSKLHPSYIGSPGSGFEGQHGVDFLPYARPLEGEAVVTKAGNSGFIGTELEAMIRQRGIRTLVIGGITTDQCVSTTTRMAENLGVCDGGWGKGRVILVTDATATFAKGTFDAETVHAVNVESLRDEFAEIWTTQEVLRAMGA
ncbi:hypothetical protein G7Y79_00025g056740 [Physcia stellaris]|nr:hypothetical protein G7Y79_00025g056740 [Physcia stellaris]